MDKEWDNQFHTLSKITLSTKLCTFHYKSCNFALVTNVLLEKWGIEPSSLCYYCHKSEETYIHLFVKCQVIQNKIWKPLQGWLDYYHNIQIEIAPYDILLNGYKDSYPMMINTILLICKYYIYVTRCLKGKVSFPNLIKKINQTKTVEEIIARKCNKMQKHEIKWIMYDKV